MYKIKILTLDRVKLPIHQRGKKYFDRPVHLKNVEIYRDFKQLLHDDYANAFT